MSILNVSEKVYVDNSIVYAELHTHQPYTTRFGNNDEVRIPIHEDMSTLPCKSYIYMKGKLKKKDGKPPVRDIPGTPGKKELTTTFVNNGGAYLFNEIRYEMNGVEIDNTKKSGLTSTIKGYISDSPNDANKLENSGWFPNGGSTVVDLNGNFNICIPLNRLLGFAEDYKKIILNIRQELVLIRSNTDTNALVGSDADVIVEIEKLDWKVPHITAGLPEELALTKYIDKNIDTQIAFRSWETHIFPTLQETTSHTWSVKTATNLETPRFLIIGFQTNRNEDTTKDMSKFDHCDIRNIRAYLNTERYPYDNLNINFNDNHFATLYHMYSKFQSSYYEKQDEPLLSPQKFKEIAPLLVIDCSNQKHALNSKAVVLRIEFETNNNVPAQTTAYCLIIHDRVFTYNALTKAVKQL